MDLMHMHFDIIDTRMVQSCCASTKGYACTVPQICLQAFGELPILLTGCFQFVNTYLTNILVLGPRGVFDGVIIKKLGVIAENL